MAKERLDIILVEKGLCQSRERARSAIMAGLVFVNSVKEDKPGTKFDQSSNIELRENPNPYVSRGGLKLEKAIKYFHIILDGKTAIDVGASTGGFTDCMLKNGAAKVYAVDVGYGQLAWELRNDSRVVNMERTNIRYVKRPEFSDSADFASIDVAFISLKKVLPALKDLMKDDGSILCLVKPQFEAGREKVGKHGVVKDPAVHLQVLTDVISFSLEQGFGVFGMTYSPIKGPEGNIEYLLYLSVSDGERDLASLGINAAETVNASHGELDN